MKRSDREILRVEELNVENLEAIATAEPPAEAAGFDHEVDEHGTGVAS